MKVAVEISMEAPTSPSKRVLVIDDEAHLREVVQTCLEILGKWTVQTAASGQEGLIKVRQELPDVIILDLVMPEMNGLAFLKQLRANSETQQVPVVLLTVRVDLVDLSELRESNVVEVIAKPFDPAELANRIANVLNCHEENLTHT